MIKAEQPNQPTQTRVRTSKTAWAACYLSWLSVSLPFLGPGLTMLLAWVAGNRIRRSEGSLGGDRYVRKAYVISAGAVALQSFVALMILLVGKYGLETLTGLVLLGLMIS